MMSYTQHFDVRQIPMYFTYRHTSSKAEHFDGIFHAHQGVEILLIHEGKGRLIVDQKTYEIKPGLICVFQPFQLHHIQMDINHETPFVRSVVQYEPSFYESYFEKWPALYAFFKLIHKGNIPMPIWTDQQETELLGRIFYSFHESVLTLPKNHHLEEFSLFLVTLFRSFKQLWKSQNINSSLEQKSRNLHQAERILEWLESHYKEPLRLEQMSNDLHLSPHHLSHLFKECTGSSISDYLSAKRMQQALLLLMSNEYPVTRIAEEVGITSCSHFCKIFKLHYGLTPHQYRKQWLEKRPL
ncbi:AraC family transcriptional regulator [Paenibacillus sp. Soil787]|uniref:AraC family transcriptional regulator n=1 Tax=Paenibacillus sp. Soil787 TaxID=1736411 RepID=UPI0007C757A6|nr:helix-turn-helix domain-containing protein [Paenibacillus sp. Soil787]